MADKSFGVKELNLLNASGTPTVTSPNNLNLNANTVAISTSCTIGNNLTVTSTTNSANVNVTGVGTLTRAFATDLSVSGISTISQPSNANPHSLWDVVNNGSSAYRFTGPGQDGAEDNPNIYLVRGQRYIFKVNASGHPFQLRVANGGAAYSDGVTNNGAQSGNVVINVQHDAPAQLYYQCTNHGSMVGNIYIVGGPQVISGVVTATTFVGNLTGNVTGTASANAVLTGSTNNTIVTVTGANAITGEATLTYNGSDTFELQPASATPAIIVGDSNRTGAGQHLAEFRGYWDGNHVARIVYAAGDDTTNKDDGVITMHTTPSGGGITERLRITSDGKIGISRTPTQHPLEIQHASEPTVSFWRGSTKGAALQSQSGGTYLYSYQNAPLLFSVNSASGYTERLRIDTSGNMGLGITPSAHSTTSSLVKSLQIGTVTNLYNESSDDYTILGNNIYYNGTNNKRIKAQESSRLMQFAATLQFDQVGADSADSNITFTTPFKIISDGRIQCGSQVVSGGMDMGFGVQQFSSKSDTYSAGIFGSTASGLITSIIYNSHASFNTNLCDWRSVRSNNSAFNFLRCSSNSAADNEFFIGGDGVVYSDGGTTMQSPADYAEMFEWSDGNSSDEDRRGYTVVLDGNKVRIATSSDSTDNIIGVVSGNPAVLADNAWDRWAEKYQKDDYNCYVRNSDGDRILNSSYDDTQTYVPREDRKEWDAIGMVGKLRVRKGQQTGTRWLKMRNVSDSIEEWLVR